ncbi:MAG: STAS domain-containing protein [Pseudomonadaceae bacterium]|nr:STAS domain-containing protein [Pseudomonadaceae bacterium]
MAVHAELENEGSAVRIVVEGRFDFSAHKDFRESYEKIETPVEGYTVDMQNATYLDSSALGMLLLLRDFAGGDSAEVSIVNCNTDVRKILSISNFEQLFRIH